MTLNFVDNLSGARRDQFRDILESVTVKNADEINGAAHAIQQVADAHKMRVAVSDDISSKSQLVDADGLLINRDIFGWTAEGERWWEDTRLALSSPLPRACRYESQPIWCNADGFHSSWQNTYLDEIDLSEYYEENVISNSTILVPVHLPFGQIASVSYSPMDRDVRDLSEEYKLYGEFLGLVTRRFITGYVLSMREKHRIPSNCLLSKREVECLHWAAIGKTDKEISMILSLSHATIRYHINRAGQKLNSVNRGQTIFKAGQLGYLGATD